MSTANWLERSARLDPDGVFVETLTESRSFGDIDRASAQRAAALARQGVRQGSVVGLWASNTLDTIISMFAINQAGAVLQLLNTRLTVGELDAQLLATEAMGVLGSDEILAAPAMSLDSDTSEELRVASSDDELAVIAYTSGTSGEPKGVMLTHGNLRAAVVGSVEHLDHGPSDSWLCVLPLFHVGGASIVWRSAFVGSRVVLHDGFDADACTRALHQVTLASLVGAMLEPILSADAGPYKRLRAVLVGGGPTSPRLMDQAWSAGIPVLSTYGMTETASQLATAPLGLPPRRRVSALSGVAIRIVGGEIQVAGAMVAGQYVGGAEPLSDDGWLATGDLGTLDSEMLAVTGRVRDIVITGGENVAPSEVETELMALDGVADCAVVGVPDDRWGELLAVVVVTDRDLASLKEELRAELAGYKIPKRWERVRQVPRNHLGKIDRNAVQELVTHG